LAAKNKIYKSKIPSSELVFRGVLIREKKLLENNYEFLTCYIKKGKLLCTGNYTPTQYSDTYIYRVEYDCRFPPKVYIENPTIDYNDEIHLYPDDNGLCLYYPNDMKWDWRNNNIYDTIIPWTNEWFVFYEKYLISGKWEHPFVKHRRVKEKV